MQKRTWIKVLATSLFFLSVLFTLKADAFTTTIVGVRNMSDQGAYIRSTQQNRGTWIAAGDSSWTDIPIPWACSAGEFEEHHIWIEHPRGHIKWVIWQCDHRGDGDWVRYNQGTGWKYRGAHLSHVNGNRFVIIRSDGSIEMNMTRGLKGRKRKAQ